MPSTNLPIRVFAQRSIDEERTEPGGGNEPPRWLLRGQELLARSKHLSAGLERCLSDNAHNEAMPYVMQASLGHDEERDATAKSKRRAVSDMFQVSHTPNVIGLKGSNTLVVAVDSSDEMHTILGRLRETDRYSEALSCIMSIEKFEPIIQFGCETNRYKVRLLDRQSSTMNKELANRFESLMKEIGLSHSIVEYSSKLLIFKLEASESQIRSIVDGEFSEGLFSIVPMPQYQVTLDVFPSEDGLRIDPPIKDRAYPILGILDSGIESLPELASWILGKRWTPYPPGYLNLEHGTFVAGIALCGDRLEKSHWVGHEGVMLYDAAVFPDNSMEALDEDDLISNIREAISSSPDGIFVWNLSISVKQPIADDSFSDFAIALDDIQDNFGVLICKSAGNTDSFKYGVPKEKLCMGADSVRALTVGSVAHAKSVYDLANAGEPSPFSRVGPGPEYTIKPEVSHYGGNAGIKPDSTASTTGVISFSSDGGLARAVGTSFSTPRIASLASTLQYSLGDPFDPLLVKALIAHSATCASDSFIPNDERVREMGFGVPGSIQDILFDDPDKATLILRSSLAKGDVIDIKDFPMPDSLVEDGYYTGQITVTVAYNPLLDASQGGEYCQSDIDVLFGTYSEKYDKDITKPNILNPIGRKDSQNLLNHNLYSKKLAKTAEGDFALRERLLVKYQGKYCPVKKYAVDLSELTKANHERVAADRLWYLRVKGLYRENIEKKAREIDITPHQEFCVIITIKDPSGRAPVYNEIAQGLSVNSFIHGSINLSNDVRIMLGQ